MKYTWNAHKNEINIRKHGIDLGDVPDMFNYPMLVGLDNREDYGEERWLGIGFLGNIIAVIVFTEQEEDSIHLISARKAIAHERKKYQIEVANGLG